MKKLPFISIIPSGNTAISLHEGQTLLAGGIVLKILRLDESGITLQNLSNGQLKQTTEAKLVEAIEQGLLVQEGAVEHPKPNLDDRHINLLQARGATEKAIEVGTAKIRWITELHRQGVDRVVDHPWVRSLIDKLAKGELKDLPAYSLSTLAETERKLRKAKGDITVIVPNYSGRGGLGKLRLDERAAEIMNLEIERIQRLGKGRIVVRDVFRDITAAIQCHNASAPNDMIISPSESTVRRQIQKLIPAHTIVMRELGKDIARKRFRDNSYPRDKAMWPLEIAEYDDVDSAVFLVDERTGLPWGRAFITNGVSQSTGVPLGYEFGAEPRSFDSAIGALCDSLRPKADCLPGQMGYGVQGQILLDNARYNESRAMKSQSEAMTLLLSQARPYGPTEKATIENFNGTIKDSFCSKLPGWAGPKEDRGALKEGINGAVMTLADFSKEYRNWLTQIYANTPGEDGKTPRQRWLEIYGRHGPTVHYSAQQIDFFRLRPQEMTLRESGGLLRLGLRYNCPQLNELRERLGATAKVQAFVSNKDPSYIVVIDPYAGSKIRVPCIEDPRYVAGLTISAQRMICAVARDSGNKNPSLKDLWEARKKLETMVDNARIKNKVRVRKWARRHETPAASGETATQQVVQECLMTDLEYQIEQLKTVDLSDQDRW